MGKLMKHDFRRTAKVVLPVYIAMLVSSILAAVLSNRIDLMFGIAVLGMLSMICELFVTFGLVFSVIYPAVTYYQSMYTDEGYLTLTMPQPLSRLLFAKYLVAAVTGVITLAYYWLLGALQLLIKGDFSYKTLISSSDLFETATLDILYELFTYLSNVITLLSLLSMLFFTITLASLLIKRARVFLVLAMSFGFYFGISTIVVLISSLFEFDFITEGSYATYMFTNSAVNLGVYLLVGAALYFFTDYILNRHLNIE